MRLITLFSIIFLAFNAFPQPKSEPSINDVKKAEKIRLIFEDTSSYIDIVGNSSDYYIAILYNANTTDSFNLTTTTIIQLELHNISFVESESDSNFGFYSSYKKNNEQIGLSLFNNTLSFFTSLNYNHLLEATGKLKEILFYNNNNKLIHKSCKYKNFPKLLYHWIEKYTPKGAGVIEK